MQCHNCSAQMKRNGKTSAGNQSWRCFECGKTKTEKLKKIQISDRVLNAIKELPQVQTPTKEGGWTEGYLIEQVLRNYLGIESDYNQHHLALILAGKIIS